MNLVPLCELATGEEAVVVAIGCEPAMRTRLNDLGLLEGSCIRCLFPSAFGDPRAYLVRGASLGIRNQDAAKILCTRRQENDRNNGSALR